MSPPMGTPFFEREMDLLLMRSPPFPLEIQNLSLNLRLHEIATPI